MTVSIVALLRNIFLSVVMRNANINCMIYNVKDRVHANFIKNDAYARRSNPNKRVDILNYYFDFNNR